MHRAPLALVVVTVLAFLAQPGRVGANPGPGFSLGVAAGDVTESSAILWAHADQSGTATVEVSRSKSFGRIVASETASVDAARDNTVRATVTGLRPHRRHYYRWTMGSEVSDVGTFRTAPPPNRTRTIRFTYSGDSDGTPLPPATEPFFGNFDVFDRMAIRRNKRDHFAIDLGDTIYSDSGVFGPPALTRQEKWLKYKETLNVPNLVALRNSQSVYGHWDDHEFINDFSVPEFGSTLYDAGKEAFFDWWPVTESGPFGIYRTARWGKNLELFFLDERSFRDAKMSAGGVCDNPPGSGVPDLAPTAPQTTRDLFSALVPSLANPVPPACLAGINDSTRTFLGAGQLAQFKSDIATSDATFKVVVNETPIQQFYALPYDRWEGYGPERTDVLQFLKDNVQNVVFLTADMHATFVNDARLKTLEPGGPVPTGILDVVTGPAATNTFAAELDAAVGVPGAATIINDLFFKLPTVLGGMGVKCSQLDEFSYAEVVVGKRKLKITPKDSRGKIIRQDTGDKCGPFTMFAQ